MSPETRRTAKVTVLVLLSLILGLIGGYVVAHDKMPEMTTGKGNTSVTPEPQIDSKPTKKDMPGMSMTPSQPGTVVLPAVQQQLIGVRTTEVKFAPLGQAIRTVGTITYDERKLTQVNLRVSGWIRKVFVDAVGKSVHKGEPLLTVYSPDLLATQEEYLLALRSEDQLAGSPLPEAKQGAQALIASARERLRLWDVTDHQIAELERRGKADPVITIYAPASGIVLKRDALPGKYAEPGTTLYELADLSTVWVYADVYESQLADVKPNQEAIATFDAYPGTTFEGKVQYIYPSVNETTRTVRVRLELPNRKLQLKPGMYGNVVIQTDQQERLVLPKEAVLDTGIRQIVFVDQGKGMYVPTEVKLGRRGEDKVEVLAGVKEGDRVVMSANFLLDAQSKLASTGSMQEMMGQIGMADWQMRGAYEAKMEGMGKGGVSAPPGREGAMKDMPGMSSSAPAKAVSKTRKVSGYVLTLSTVPATPKAGETVLRLKLADPEGKQVTNANVLFVYTMPMPGMTDSKVTAVHTKDGVYEGKAMLGMAGTWEVRVTVIVPGRPAITEKFQIAVAGGGT
ncbi:MAG TPA: efflux RND transporter periplasmic adaptor subunit [Terriglobales bacterium]|nr:efflux RND transporter periplasmic adaptor subunit [Terriglobales bacterium]